MKGKLIYVSGYDNLIWIEHKGNNCIGCFFCHDGDIQCYNDTDDDCNAKIAVRPQNINQETS